MTATAEERMPSRLQALAFRFKAICFRTKRSVSEIRCRPKRHETGPIKGDAEVAGESRSLLYPSNLGAEFALQVGKVQNLRVAVRHLNGLTIPAGEVFSFWAHVPRPTRRSGFVPGRELREGCVIPSVGGGLCQLSNALFDAALKAGFEIVERHGHSRVLPGSMAESGRDATIFWNYVDLRFKHSAEFQIEAILGRGELVVRLRSAGVPQHTERSSSTPTPALKAPAGDPVESCETCGITSCFRHPETLNLPTESTTAWLVDAYWPEYNKYIQQQRSEQDWLFTPLKGSRYQWSSEGFARVKQSPLTVIRRSIRSRKLAAQGAARQRALLEMDERLASSYARRIPFTATHLVVSQNLLPFLWKDGVLGGRTFDVLMTRLPIENLQETLDRAAKRWPKSPTLADFRADPSIQLAESEALKAASHWITPHSMMARIAGDKAIKLAWEIPAGQETYRRGDGILFPASTLGRKGAWEMRELDLPLRLAGPVLESSDFWEGRAVERTGYKLDGIGVVALPAWVEHQPRRLLQAVAAGIPVVAGEACGLAGVAGVREVESGDIEGLASAIDQALVKETAAV